MRRAGLFVVALLLTAVAIAPAAQQMRAEVALKAAVEQETVKGDLKGAIAAYQRIVGGYPDNRAVRAQALIRMAECYQKLGDAQAKASFERVVKEFGDQPAAVQARAALARMGRPASAAPALPATRLVWQAPPSFFWFSGPLSPDGRVIPYMDWQRDRQDLNFYDVAANESRTFLKGGRQSDGSFASVTSTAFSPDGSQLAYVWDAGRGTNAAHDELRIVRVGSRDAAEPRILLNDAEIDSIWLGAWSPDGASIAAVLLKKGGERELVLVTAASGAVRTLKRVGTLGSWGMQFSGDGQFLIYDLGGPAADRDIYAIKVADGGDRRLIEFPGTDIFAGFTPDGRRIVFSSLRAGVPGIWTADYANGSISNPQLVKPDLAIDSPWGITADGALYYVADGRAVSDVRMGEFDTRTGRFTSAPADIPAEILGVNSAPALSPDGKWHSYLRDRRTEGLQWVVRPVAGGAARTFPVPLQFRNGNRFLWNWTVDSAAFYAVGTSQTGVTGIHRIDATSGQLSWSVEAPLRVMLPIELGGNRLRYAEPRGGAPEGVFIVREFDLATRRPRELYRSPDDCRMSPDGGDAVYCIKGDRIIRRDITSGAEEDVAAYEAGRAWMISPDNRWLVTYRSGAGRTDRSMWVTDMRSGETRQLATDGQNFFVLWWSPESNAVLATVGNPQESRETWWIPMDGSKPHRIEELSGQRLAGPGASGRQGQFSHGRFVWSVVSRPGPTELSVLENFLPPTSKKSGL